MRRVEAGAAVLRSMITCPGRAAPMRPLAPSGPRTTLSTTVLSGSDSSTGSLPSHTAAGESAALAPAAAASPARTS